MLVGLDGFVDEIIAVVDKRHDFGRFEPMRTIGHLGHRILGAAGNSSNLELVTKQVKLGGNGPIMAGAVGGRHSTDLCRLLRQPEHPSGLCRPGGGGRG